MAGQQRLEGKKREAAYLMLHKVCRLLEAEGIPYVLEAGTLLGVVREDRLLPWDNDVDLTVCADYAKKLIKIRPKIRRLGFRSRLRSYKRNTGPFEKGQPRILKVQTRKALLLKGYSLLDIFIKYKIGDTYQWTVDERRPVLKKCPADFYERRVSLPFDGARFWVPEQYRDYLAYHYGEDWTTPVKEWDYRRDDHCEKEELPADSPSGISSVLKRLRPS